MCGQTLLFIVIANGAIYSHYAVQYVTLWLRVQNHTPRGPGQT